LFKDQEERNNLMSTPDQQLAFSARFLRRSFALACAALLLLLLGSSANASSMTVLQFGQTNPLDIITATDVAGTTTLSTAGNIDGGLVSVPVTITNFLGTPGLAIPAFETFVGVMSTGPATGSVSQPFSGTIEITSGIGGTGLNYLTATFGPGPGGSSPTLAGTSGGFTANLTASDPPQSLVLTTDPIFTTILSPPSSMNIAIGNITPALGTAGGSIDSFIAQNSGTFSASTTVIPEPGTLCLASFGVVFGVLVYRKKR
jgi:hypothetical protein